ncbi:MAG: heme-binding domain-containing protein [Bacteroidetes bacterium]|nr:heme-binding domain-containing protein [Bacteroidota bacterium]MBS1539438.1 heme-binding domain-containing protein [Bacteroidota bacterium]
MTRTKKILLALAAILVIIQFIRPARNTGEAEGPNFIATKYNLPEEVHTILKQSCYDCHSNHTNYPWYTNIQPLGWWIQYSHINDGKRHLNFSEYATYKDKRAKHKMEDIIDEMKEGGMPLGSYTFIHRDTKLTAEQTKTITDWATAVGATIQVEEKAEVKAEK